MDRGAIAAVSLYLRPDELHTAFNPGHLIAPWNAHQLRAAIGETVTEHDSTRAGDLGAVKP